MTSREDQFEPGSGDVGDPTGIAALLASIEDPGPMPPEVIARIDLALEAEQALPTPVVPLAQAARSSRRPRWTRMVGVAAAAAVVISGGIVGLTAAGPGMIGTLWGSTTSAASDTAEQSGADALSDDAENGQGDSRPTSSAPAPTQVASVMDFATGTNYTSNDLVDQARALAAMPRPTAGGMPDNSSSTAIRAVTCLDDAGVPTAGAVSSIRADRAHYEGNPATIVTILRDGVLTAYVFPQDCGTNSDAKAALAGPVTVP
ncbi:MAG: hypothetical protein ACK5MP_13400 [Nostocoides sp.]